MKKETMIRIGLTVCVLCTLAACRESETKEERAWTEKVGFAGMVTSPASVGARSTTIMGSTDQNYGDIFIRQQIDEEEPTIATYVVASGQQGILKIKEDDKELNWSSPTAKHTFWAWTRPAGVFNASSETDPGLTKGTVTFGTNADFENFIVTKKGPVSYVSWGQYVALTFVRPICKIQLLTVNHVQRDGSIEAVDNCIVRFPNQPLTASFGATSIVSDGEKLTTNPLTVTTVTKEDTGVTWNWDKQSTPTVYLFPFSFAGTEEQNLSMEQQPGYFEITFDNRTYIGTLANLSGLKELNAGEYLQLKLQITDGTVTGFGSIIVDWNTQNNAEVPQHRIPGVYTAQDASALLAALQDGTVPDYLIHEIDKEKYIPFFTHIDWSSFSGKELVIPAGYTLDGQGFNLTLPEGVTLSGNIVNLYVNGEPWESQESPEPPTENP